MSKRGGTFWTDARFSLEVLEPGGGPPRLVPIPRPFALIGRIAQADLQFDDREVSARHVYLHSDDRGVFAIDLATRTGTRFNGAEAPCGWLTTGEELEIAGRVVRIESFELGGQPITPPPCALNLLTDAGDSPLVGLAIEPVAGRGAAWVVGSELAFVGRGDGCAIRLNQASVSRTHCVLLRTSRAAFVIDLPGQPTLVNGSPPRGAAIIREGDILTLGQVRFVARVTSIPGFEEERVGELGLAQPVRHDLSRYPLTPGVSGLPAVSGQSFPIELVPPESRDAVLGWMLGSLHASQAEILRRQDDIQHSLGAFLQQLHIEAGARHEAQTAQLEALAAEVRRLAAQQVQPAPAPGPPGYHPLPYSALPGEPPRPARDVPSAPEIDPDKTFATAAWLLERIEKVGNENKFTFRSLLSRLGGTPRTTGDAETDPESAGS